jgi:hypothetical protein
MIRSENSYRRAVSRLGSESERISCVCRAISLVGSILGWREWPAPRAAACLGFFVVSSLPHHRLSARTCALLPRLVNP